MRWVLHAVLPLSLAALSACVQPDQLIETPNGPVLVIADESLARFSTVLIGGAEVSPVPEFGGLLALDPDGAPLSPNDRARAEAGLELHCGGPVGDLSYRGFGDAGLSTWSSAPCGDIAATDELE